ncbi:TetR family transcriptional regulator [Halopolyspora algeriensis]|uniref:TetR family transcriptional regulator n=1 Tax=Halopolyspora algeriensis TaxID=1500506 RepID=A0A368VTH7_9ACTN|nr:TetR/AcrR family transcriptional regulator [Halopolyspora algeriensis]RCW45290.1 TetR family transcriptional regulator [Halopolyspora algeriensis]TQM47330.1 TetR family transcriptional regulator [Halopolyspora algeriensis]
MEAEQADTHPVATASRKRLPRAERERQILEVAEEVFATRGYQTTSMDDIAQRVGLSKPMLYEYFGSKDGLLLACLERARRELLESTTAAAANAVGPEQLLHDGLLAFFRFSDEHRQAWALLRNESTVPSLPVNSELESIRSQQVEFTADMLRLSLPNMNEERLEAFAEAIIGACERLAMWRERRPEITPEVATEHLMALVSPSLTTA